MRHLSSLWSPAPNKRALRTLLGLSLILAPVLFAVPAHAFLYDTFAGGPGFPNRIDDRIEAMLPTDYVDIIVDFCHEPTSADSTFLDGFGDIYAVFSFIDAIAVKNVLASDCYLIVNYPGLKLIEWDEPVTPDLDISSCAIQARSSAIYPYPAMAAWSMNPWAGFTGNGVTVAILDSGVDDGHPALAGKFVAGYDAFTGLGGPGVNPDDDWAGWFHGTAVAGMIMANDPGQVYMGVAPQANLVDCKVFNSAGATTSSRVIGAIAWLYYGNGAAFGVDVANMSFSASVDDGTSALARAASALTSVGIIPVASGGNSPPSSGVPSPGSGDAVICVGGVTDNATVVRTDDTFDSGARIGPRTSPPPLYTLSYNDLKPEVSAYMRNITTCQGVNPGQNSTGWWQHPGNGTSWSTAHVSGVVAVLLEKYPGLTSVPWFQLENVLRLSAEARGTPTYPLLDPTWNSMYGWGIASAAAAVNLVLPVDVTVQAWVPGLWNSKAIWAGHYPVKVGDPNTLNARVTAIGGPASGVVVTFEAMNTGWGGPWTLVGSTTVNVGYVGTGAVATIAYTPPPGMEGHRCFRVTATYSADPNHSNDTAQENIDIQPAKGAALFAADGGQGTATTLPAAMARGTRDMRFAFPVTMCVEETAPFPFRTADACICTKDLPPGASAWLEPEPPFDLMPGECQPCSLIVLMPEGVVPEPGDAVHVNGWFWGNGVAEGGVTVYFYSTPPIEATIAEVQYTDDPTGPSPMEGQTVTVSGVATTENSTYPDRFAIQDGEGPWSGIFVRDVGLEVNRGDSLTVTGVVVETDGLTELDLLTDFETVSAGNPVPPPEVVPPSAVDLDESYEGVLVSVEDVLVVDPNPDDWMLLGPDGTLCRVGHWGGYSYVPTPGDELDVTGVSGSLYNVHRLQPRDDDDIEPATGTPEEGVRVLSMSQNAPNPFGGSTGITYALPHDSYVVLRVYNVAGKVVKTLVDGEQPAGTWNVAWDGADEQGHGVAAGVYFYRLETGGRTIARRMVLIQ